jgi:hypothetical protein
LILKDEADAWLPVAVIEKEPSAGGVVSASDALNVAKPGFHAISFDFCAKREADTSICARTGKNNRRARA